jgi:hypothetical protein
MADTGDALEDNVWQAHRASQTLAHFGEAELELLSAYYQGIGYVRSGIGSEADSLGVIRVLQGDPARLGPPDIAGLRVAIQRARFANYIVAGISRGELRISKSLHIDVPAPSASRLREVCQPLQILGAP